GPAMTILATRQLDRRFGGVHAVRGVDLEVSAGEIVGLFGPNGAGKTTLFNLIAGNFPPHSGRVMLRGEDLTPLPAWRRALLGIGRTFQVTRPFRDLTTLQNVLTGVPRTGSPRRHDVQAARSLLAKVGLGDRADELAG